MVHLIHNEILIYCYYFTLLWPDASIVTGEKQHCGSCLDGATRHCLTWRDKSLLQHRGFPNMQFALSMMTQQNAKCRVLHSSYATKSGSLPYMHHLQQECRLLSTIWMGILINYLSNCFFNGPFASSMHTFQNHFACSWHQNE